MTDRPIRVLVTEDHDIVRKGICALLVTEPQIEVVGEARDGSEAIRAVHSLHPDVILMDLVMPGIDGLEATRRIVAEQPDARVLVLTSFAGDDKLFPAIEAGALGYLLKDSTPEDLVEAICQVYRGESSLDPAIARKVLLEFARPSHHATALSTLSSREEQVLRLVSQGYTNREIAQQLDIAEATVRTHVSGVLTKLKVSNRTQAALYALREGLASLTDLVLTACVSLPWLLAMVAARLDQLMGAK
ncbi:MAG: response regulator transcription factor [Anaerolineae bacterium]|nr:response regulator transcription factor [Anaerolineae bacterium]